MKDESDAYLDEGSTINILALIVAIICSVLFELPLIPTFASAKVLPFSRVCPVA
jgi:hypothetical protein